MKIMLVDDSRTMRNIQKNVLAQLGYSDIVEAADGQEALKVAEAEKPELILLDWNMPKLDGLGFLKEFRGANKTTPVIMVTTEAEKARVVEAIKAGVNNYVIKPFTPELLQTRINETLEKKAA
ncbi:MAG: response regulator [Candidatus Eisenbacteria bacterium]|uniref:Response regulator n=1 Tax=Eiseniibacteriota bacterium TaxID=2212470 RepID=A0A956RML8_UNCEI|nr:response regulator [Candidatus Eisenbacteria bacterium]